jgi:hypothetical protein
VHHLYHHQDHHHHHLQTTAHASTPIVQSQLVRNTFTFNYLQSPSAIPTHLQLPPITSSHLQSPSVTFSHHDHLYQSLSLSLSLTTATLRLSYLIQQACRTLFLVPVSSAQLGLCLSRPAITIIIFEPFLIDYNQLRLLQTTVVHFKRKLFALHLPPISLSLSLSLSVFRSICACSTFLPPLGFSYNSF